MRERAVPAPVSTHQAGSESDAPLAKRFKLPTGSPIDGPQSGIRWQSGYSEVKMEAPQFEAPLP